MRITKVKAGKKMVTAGRNTHQGYLLHGNEEIKDNQAIYKFICTKKFNSLSLSIVNSLVPQYTPTKTNKKEENKKKEIFALMKIIFKNCLINTLKHRGLAPNNTYTTKKTIESLAELLKHEITEDTTDSNKPEDPLNNYIKYQFKAKKNKPSKYLDELRQAIKNSTNTEELANKLTHFNNWIGKKLNKFLDTERSIYYNKIEVGFIYTKSTSPRKQFLNHLLSLLKDQNNLSQVTTHIEELQDKYQLNKLLEGLQTITYYYNKNGEQLFKRKLFQEYKVYLQKDHQHLIFGKGTKEELKNDKKHSLLANREDTGLYAYHNEVKDYLEHYFPFRKEAEEQYIEANKEKLNITYVKKVIKNKILNKLIQHLIFNGKLIHEKEIANNTNKEVNSTYLQAIKIAEVTRRKLSDDITFAANRLKGELPNKILPEEIINTIINSELYQKYKDWKKPNPTDTSINKEKAKIVENLLFQLKNNGYKHHYLDQFLNCLKEATKPIEKKAINNYTANYKNVFNNLKKWIEIIKVYNDYINSLNARDFLTKKPDKEDPHQKEITTIIKELSQYAGLDGESMVARYEALSLLRNATFHVQNIKELPKEKITPLSPLILTDIENSKTAFIRKLLSNNVLAYYEKQTINKILENDLYLGIDTVAFAPAFKHVINRAYGLNNNGWAKHIAKKHQRPENYARYYLFNLLYYHYFLPYFTHNKKDSFKKAITKLKNDATARNNNEEVKGYRDFYLIKFNNVQHYLAEIQSLETNQRQKQAKAKNEDKKTEDKPYYQRYIQDIFVAGFETFITAKADLINEKQVKRIDDYDRLEGEEKALTDYKDSIHIHININTSYIDQEVIMWYAFLSLLDLKHLNYLKGDILKYQQAQTQFELDKIFSISCESLLELISLRMLNIDSNPSWLLDKEQQIELISHFLDIDKSKGLSAINAFEPKETRPDGERQQMYLSGNELILTRAFNKIQKYQTAFLFKKLEENLKNQGKNNNNTIKVTVADCQSFYQQEKNIAERIKKRESIHKQWVNNKSKIDINDYIELIKKEHNYIWLKNKINLVHIERLNDLIQDIWSMWISTAYLWERDIYYATISLLKYHNALETTQIKNDESKVGIVSHLETKHPTTFNLINSFFGKLQDIKDIRNTIAHYYYLRGRNKDKSNPKSLLDYLVDIRKLVSYDRKLKNAVAKSFIDLLDKHGIIIRFKPLHQTEHQFKIAEIKPKKITHLGGHKFNVKGTNKQQTITTDQVHKDYVKMVKALLELKG